MDTSSEQYRAICEARYVMKMRDVEARREYIRGVQERRGIESANKLRADIYQIWKEQRDKNNAG